MIRLFYIIFLNFDIRDLVLVSVLTFVRFWYRFWPLFGFGIGFDTESTEPFFRTGSRVMD
jgi:hypothetical protein